MENTIAKYGIIIAAAIALPKTILVLFQFLKWCICFLGLILFPKRTEKALRILSKHFGSQTVFTAQLRKAAKDSFPQKNDQKN